MVYKSFRVGVIARVAVLAASLLLAFYLLRQANHPVSGTIMIVLNILLVLELIRYVERTNRKLTQFLDSIRHSDFASSFSDKGKGKSFNELNRAFNEVINDFKKTRAEKEEHFNYLQTVVQHVSIGIIAFRKDGKVDLLNNAAKRLLRIKNLRLIGDLRKVKSDLPDLVLKMKAGDKHLCKVFIEDELIQLSIYATEFRMRGEEYVLVSLQNISTELDEKEVESWQKLIRVLTHEIMNSITPISSLVSTVRQMLFSDEEAELKLSELDAEDSEGVLMALKTIQNRSQGLLNFVEIYRNLTRIPKPNFRYFPVKEIFERAEILLNPKFEQLGIRVTSKVMPADVMITADPDLIDQVTINLLLNAIDAVKATPDPQISMVASQNPNGRIGIDISDNGTGIKPDILDKIFMPFFTSKREGNGIGLSLSRQMMYLHKGNITVKSKPGEGSVFTLTF
ncbi:MAG TPA: ATP-binding protein [Bacteroidales bacterium]|nr:ATP-binding protein [Bacteroidales bacterium]